MVMMITSFTLAGPIGMDALPVSIQCSIDATKPSSFHIEGASLSPAQSKEIAVRVLSSILATSLCAWPEGRVTVTIRVDAQSAKLYASALDLPIALAIAGVDVDGLLVAGELGLDGSVRSVRGALQAAILAKTLGMRGALFSAGNAREASEATDLAIYVIGHLTKSPAPVADLPKRAIQSRGALDFSDVHGQSEAIAAVERSVATRAGLLLSGSPGVGKTMIARRIPGLLPQMSRDEQIEVTRAYSALGLADGLVTERPFRAPHYTISAVALAGGDSSRRPGELHLATRGVLFLDEISVFPGAAIEALVQALREMPVASRPLVVASANPCPCGFRDSGVRVCSCTNDTVKRYAARVQWAASKLGLSITATLHAVTVDVMRGSAGESTAAIAERILAYTERS